MTGFYVFAGTRNGKSVEWFICTKQMKRTKTLARKVLELKGKEATPELIDYLFNKMQAAHCEIKECSHGKYYNIYGENFSGCGCFLDGRDGTTEIITIN